MPKIPVTTDSFLQALFASTRFDALMKDTGFDDGGVQGITSEKINGSSLAITSIDLSPLDKWVNAEIGAANAEAMNSHIYYKTTIESLKGSLVDRPHLLDAVPSQSTDLDLFRKSTTQFESRRDEPSTPIIRRTIT